MSATVPQAPTLARHTSLISTLVGIFAFVLTIVTIESRPDGTDWSVWRPASGLAVGVAAWYGSRDAWRVAIAAGLANGLGSGIAGRPLLICMGSAVVAALEAWVGSRVLRGRTGGIPTLSSGSALRRLILATTAVGLVTAIGLGAAAAAGQGPEQVIPTVLATTPTHMAGALLIAPLFFASPLAAPRIRRRELLAQWTTLALLVVVTFRFDNGLPVSFLVLPPVIWGASRLPYRMFTVQLALTSLVIARTTANGFGPFGSLEISDTEKTLLSGSLSLVAGMIAFAMIASSAHARTIRAALDATEAIYRESMEASLMGVGVLTEADGALWIGELNPAGREMLGSAVNESMAVVNLFTADDARLLRSAVENVAADPSMQWSREHLETPSGQVLEASLFVVVGPVERHVALQFIDVTARVRALAVDAAERRRAVDIQAALVPTDHLAFPGYQIAGRSMASRALGGDFYDWYAITGGFLVTVGDVMGKGTGASMVAAALRTSLRLEGRSGTPAAALSRVAAVIEEELSTASTFSTVFSARIRSEDGRVQYADAGHGLALHCGSDGSVTQLESRGLPVGVLAGSRWQNSSTRLAPGDTLVVFSDGVLDLFDESLVAFDEIARMSFEARSSSELLERIFGLVDPDALDDDITVIAIRRNDIT